MAQAHQTDLAPHSLSVGLTARMSRRVGETDVEVFAAVSGDANPIHLDEAYAKASLMKGRVVHGALLAGFISAVLGAELPGPGAIYLSQTLNFRRPVRIGDEVTIEVAIRAIEGDDVTLSTVCLVRRKVAVDGEATLRIGRRRTRLQDEAV